MPYASKRDNRLNVATNGRPNERPQSHIQAEPNCPLLANLLTYAP